MAYVDLDDLLQVSAEIMQLDEAEASLGKGREWKAAKQLYDASVEQFNEKRKVYVNELLVKGEDWSSITNAVSHELDGIESGADSSWHPAVKYTRENLIPYLRREAEKKPWVRDVIKWTPWALATVGAIAFFGIRLTSGVEITAPIESRHGIQQRAAAAKKVIRYDDWMGTHVRRGGWLKGIMFWPIEPSEAEVKGAGEFVSLTLDGYDVLSQRHKICGTLIAGYGDKLSKEQVTFVSDIADETQRDDIKWLAPPALTILLPIKTKYPC